MDQYHQQSAMPATVFGYVPRAPYLDSALEHARAELEPVYYNYASSQSNGSCTWAGTADANVYCPQQQSPDALSERIRKTNLAVQLANGQVSHSARFAEVQPKMCRDGRFPPGFATGLTVEQLRALPADALDCLLQAYYLPTDARSFQVSTRDMLSAGAVYRLKLCTLFDYLGVSQISDYERLSRNSRFNSV